MSAWSEKKRKPVPAWLVEKNRLRSDTAAADRKALADAVREARLARRKESE